MKEELGWDVIVQDSARTDFATGDEWTKPDLFRIGASSLLTDIERQLYHCAFKRYAAKHQLALA